MPHFTITAMEVYAALCADSDRAEVEGLKNTALRIRGDAAALRAILEAPGAPAYIFKLEEVR